MVAEKMAEELAKSLEKSTIPHWMMDLTGQKA